MELGNIINYKKGKAPTRGKLTNELVIYLSPEYLRNRSKKVLVPDFFGKVEVNNGDLLLLWDGSNAGEFFLGKDGVLSSTMVKLFFDEKENDRTFLYYQLKSIEDFLKSQTNGSGIPHVDKEILLSIDVEHFSPKEQTQIANILSKADEAITQTEQLIAKYTRIKTGLMHDLLTKGIDEHGNIRSEATHEFKDSPLGKIPKEWDTVKLVDIGSKNTPYLKTGPFGSSLKSEHWEETGIPVITIGSLGDNDFIKKNLLYISNEKADELNAYKLIDGDILFSRVAEIGRSLVIGKKNNGWVMSSNFMRLRLNTEIYNPLVLNLIIKHSSSFIRQVAQNVNESGRSVTNSKILNSFIFPKIPMVEQSKMVDGYFKIDISLNEVNKQLSKLQSLKTGLMQDLLSGKVRVNYLNKETMKA